MAGNRPASQRLSCVLIAAVAFYSFGRISNWCTETKPERWPVELWASPTAHPISDIVCPGVNIVNGPYNQLCPKYSPGLLEWLFEPRFEDEEEKKLVCRVGDGVNALIYPETQKSDFGLLEAVQKSCVFIRDILYKIYWPSRGFTCSYICPFSTRLETSLTRFYNQLVGEPDDNMAETLCGCLDTNDTGSSRKDSVLKPLLFICVGTFFLFAFSLCFYKRPETPVKVVWKSLIYAVVSKYRPVKLLRSNANFNIFLMVCRDTNKLAYVKCLREECSRVARKQLSSELQALKMLKHPKIIVMIDSVQVGTRCSLGIEYAPFGSLGIILTKTKLCYSLPQKRSIFRQIIDAVSWVHSHGWAHLNVRAESVLVFDKTPLIKLSGFCRARKTLEGALCTAYDLHPFCCAPWIKRRHPYDPIRADLWALRRLFSFISSGNNPGMTGDEDDCPPEMLQGDGSENLQKIMADFVASESFGHSYFSIIRD